MGAGGIEPPLAAQYMSAVLTWLDDTPILLVVDTRLRSLTSTTDVRRNRRLSYLLRVGTNFASAERQTRCIGLVKRAIDSLPHGKRCVQVPTTNKTVGYDGNDPSEAEAAGFTDRTVSLTV